MPFIGIGVDNDYRAFMIASRRIAARYLTLQGKWSRGVRNDSRGMRRGWGSLRPSEAGRRCFKRG